MYRSHCVQRVVKWIKNINLLCSCWKGAGWSGGAYTPVDNKAAASPNTTKLSRMRFQWAAGRSKAKPPLSPTPQRRTTPVAEKSRLLSTRLNSESREKHPTPSVAWESWMCCLLKLHLNSSKMVTKSTPERSLVSLRHPASYQNLPVTGWEKTGLSRATGAESRWPSTWSLCWRFRFNHDCRVLQWSSDDSQI